MSCFTVQILPPSGRIIEVDTCVGDSISSITIDNKASPNILLSECVAQLPSDFNDRILFVTSGIIPVKNIIGGSGINVSSNSGNYTVAVTGNFGLTGEEVDDRVASLLSQGSNILINYDDLNNSLTISTSGLQPSGNYSIVGHAHTNNDIIDFNNSVSGLLPVKNINAGSGISVTNNSGDFVVSVTGQFGLTSEQVDDRVANLLVGTNYINLNYDDDLNKLVIQTSGLQPSGNYSVVGHSHVISDVSGLQLALDNKQPSGSYASSIHNHTSSDITDFNSSVSGLIYGIYAPLLSPSFSGIPTVPTAISGTNSTQIASTAFVRNEISNLVDSAPSTLDTLNELASALNDDPNFATTIASGLANKAPLVHTHVVNDITDFNSGVSGLLPITNITGSSGIIVSNSGTIYDISSSGLAFISGANFNSLSVTGVPVSVSGHLHDYNDIINWASGIENEVSTLLVAGNYINIDYDNDADTLTINATGLQPSGNYSLVGHSHVIADVSGLQNVLDSKQNTLTNPVTGTGSSNHIAYWTSSSGISYDDNQLYWDSSSNELGIGTNNPARNIDVVSSAGTSVGIKLNSTATGGRSYSFFSTNNSSSLGGGKFGMYDDTAQASRFVIDGNGNIGIGTNSPGYKLDVVGSGNFSQNVLVNGVPVSVSGHPHVISDISGLQTALDSKQPSGVYASGVHYHIVSDISDFNTGVSGLLPSVSGSGYVQSSFNNNSYTISVSGLQPSGNYANSVHTHSSSEITDFTSSVSGLLPVKDIVAGTGIGISSTSGIYTINSTGSGVLADQAKSIVTTVFNDTGSPVSKMSAVYINGGHGDRPTIALAVATGDPTSAGTYGVTFEAIPNMSTGKVIVFGALTGVDTDIFNPTAPHGNVNGQVLYLSPTTPGGLTLTKPSAPNHIVAIGTIVRTHQNEGVIEVRVQNGFELEELHNVAISGVTSGQFLQYNSSSGLWIPSSSGNFNTLLVNGTGVSLVGHTHSSSDITDFNTAVSGLLPVTDLVAGSGIVITPSGSVFTINSTGGGGSGADEIEEYIAASGLPASGDLNILYRTTDDGRLYQWSGNEYAELGPDNVTTGYHAYQHASNGLDPVLNVVSRPASLSGNVNNYAHNNADILYIDSSASYNITGLVSSSDGSVKLIINKSAFTLILTHQDTNSDPSNRFLVPFGSNYNLLAGYGITIVYDSDAARWRVLA